MTWAKCLHTKKCRRSVVWHNLSHVWKGSITCFSRVHVSHPWRLSLWGAQRNWWHSKSNRCALLSIKASHKQVFPCICSPNSLKHAGKFDLESKRLGQKSIKCLAILGYLCDFFLGFGLSPSSPWPSSCYRRASCWSFGTWGRPPNDYSWGRDWHCTPGSSQASHLHAIAC